jgi:hypothetical protein
VIAQTSNEHLDELNARAQAIRLEHGQLGRETLPVPGRPYALHPGDEIQIRRTIPHPEHGQLRNGTAAHIATIDPAGRTVTLQLADEQNVTLDGDQVARADVRLAYVQHPFPAQGQTTDTAHLIIAEHATREGSYVALTRARERTHIHAASPVDEPSDGDRLKALSDRMSRTEPDLPSIHTPLAHESDIRAELAQTSIDAQYNGPAAPLTAEPSATSAAKLVEPATSVPATSEAHAPEPEPGVHRRVATPLEPKPESSPEPERSADRATGEVLDERGGRVWPRHDDLTISELTNDQVEDDRRGWEL